VTVVRGFPRTTIGEAEESGAPFPLGAEVGGGQPPTLA
jgi:hypothetical protein